jgi:hypothetical protein
MQINFDEVFSCKDITKSSLNLYKTKLTILNDNKPIKNINFLYDIENITKKINHLKPNTRRTYIIAIVSLLACMNKSQKVQKKLKKLYEDYSKLMDEYNTTLKDQTKITDGTKIISNDDINKIYERLKQNKDKTKRAFQDYLILSLYTLLPPRRNLDYQLMKYIKKYNENLSNDFNYYDGSTFYFNNYKTRGTYNKQEVQVPSQLQEIINYHINNNHLNENDFILRDFNKETEIKGNNGMTIILNRIFGDKIGASMLRRSYLSNKYSDVQNDLQSDAKAMSTSISTAIDNYIKKK